MKASTSGMLGSLRFDLEISRAEINALPSEYCDRVVEYLRAARKAQGSDCLRWLKKAVAILEQSQRAQQPSGKRRWFGRKAEITAPLEIQAAGGIDSSESFEK